MRRLWTPEGLDSIADMALRQVIGQRFVGLTEIEGVGFDELAEFWLVEPGDTVESLEATVGLPITHGWFSDTRYTDPDFTPAWEVLGAHDGGYEMVFVTGDSGYGTVLWIGLSGTDEALLDLCRR